MKVQIRKFQPYTERLSNALHDFKQREQHEKEEELNQAKQRQFEMEIELEKLKFKQRLELEAKLEEIRGKPEVTQKQISVKLPKLEITKFKGTHMDWFRFWSQFETEVDKQNIDPVTKFNYLKEFLEPKVRSTIENLNHSSEGYERAKQILKSKYGKPSEVINAHVQSIMALPHIRGSNPSKIHDFFNKLLPSVQALESMGKLREISGYTRATLDKLEGIRADLVRLDDEWQLWGFPQLVEALCKWTEQNPIYQHQEGRDKVFTTNQGNNHGANKGNFQRRSCVFCESNDHKSVECTVVTKTTERRDILRQKRLCFNCTGGRHRASECQSKGSCKNCKARHHSSICDKSQSKDEVLVATGEMGVVYPVVIVRVEGVKCRALLDTGAGSSYVSTKLAETIGQKPYKREHRKIDMMMSTTTTKIEMYKYEIKDVKETFSIKMDVSKVDRRELLTIPNPKYKEIIRSYPHLKGVVIDDTDEKAELPIHMIIGASDFAKIKTPSKPRIGNPGEPVAELTSLGWALISPGHEADLSKVFLTKSSKAEYEQLCSLDVLGLRSEEEQDTVHQEFSEQLERSPEGWYQTGLMWKPGIQQLPNNEMGSKARLRKLVQRLERKPELFDKYEEIIKDQEEQGIIEKMPGGPSGVRPKKEFYLPHREVVRESAESTKVRIVYDASARADDKSPSLNDCLETGPPLQNKIWDILTRNRLQPVMLSGDVKQAFLQIRIREEDRDVLRFHWLRDRDTQKLEIYRFTRVLFGCNQSPFLLCATLEKHLKECEDEFPKEVAEIKQSMYVDDVLLGGGSVQEVQHLKEAAMEIFDRAKFQLHKWHSNREVLERDDKIERDLEESFAKQQLGTKESETKLLGVGWNKQDDTLLVSFGSKDHEVTKRGVLQKLASVYDPLGLAAPVTLMGKIIYRDICDRGCKWDSDLPDDLKERWKRWLKSLPEKVTVPRSVSKEGEIRAIDLHAFADASGNGVATAVYATVFQETGTGQELLTAKARIAKKGLTIPRLELVAGHMAANVVDNVKRVLQGYPVRKVYGWLDSSVALHWIRGESRYKQFVSNRVAKIKEKEFIEWRHVPTELNPADVASRGAYSHKLGDQWYKGPSWLQNSEDWPAKLVTGPTVESEAESLPVKTNLSMAVETSDELDAVLQKFHVYKAMRITAWMRRFIENCKSGKENCLKGPLTTQEIREQIEFWVRRVQSRNEKTEKFKADQQQLGLQKNDKDIYVCIGRIQGEYPIYLPTTALFTERLVMEAHLHTLHGGVGYTMARVRENYWIPRLRRLTKRVIKSCHGCKRFQAVPYSKPKPGLLPNDRTEGARPFEVIGVDYAGPVKYKTKKNKEGKGYILLFSCSLTRAVYIELLPDQTVESLIPCIKRLVARRGRPQKVYSDNAKTFAATAKWIKQIMKDEKFKGFLANQNIAWQFNLSKAPWWGGQFERIIGLTKQAMFKTIGGANLKWEELQEVLLDVEITLNNRPLSYVEDDIQLPLLTPNMMMLGTSNALLQPDVGRIENKDLRKRAKYLQKCRENLWKRWRSEYLRALRERHSLQFKDSEPKIREGDVIVIKGDEKNRGEWSIGIVEKLIEGKDGIVRAARIRTRKTHIERALQLLYPLELSCDRTEEVEREGEVELNPQAEEFRPKRRAAEVAKETVRETFRYEDKELEDNYQQVSHKMV